MSLAINRELGLDEKVNVNGGGCARSSHRGNRCTYPRPWFAPRVARRVKRGVESFASVEEKRWH